jgi:chromosome segregation and condensation protein ScpB
MRAMLAPALVLATLFAGSAITSLGCDEKMGVEKRAEEIAKSASAQKMQASASASQVDPAELKYRERKTELEKTVKAFRAEEGRFLAGDPTVKAGALAVFMENAQAAKDLEAKLKKDGADFGSRLVKMIEPFEIRLNANFEDAEVELTEQRGGKNSVGCLLYVEKWKRVSDKWVLTEVKQTTKVDCP